MGRIVRNWKPDRVEDSEVAPHRYTWENDHRDLDSCNSYEEIREAIPYKEGEVVYVDVGGEARRARIIGVFYERNFYGERRAKFRVQFETAKGFWSKQWEMTFPGFIQRGYQRGGLAPDVPA